MKKFFKYILKPMGILSCIASLGIFIYWITYKKVLLAMSIIIYLGLAIGNVIKFFYKDKCGI